jgi:hypothetical protein
MQESELREVYSAANVTEAHLLRDALEEAGIEAMVVGDELFGAIGSVPGISGAPKLMVKAEDYEPARKIVTEHELANRKTTAPPWKCASCGELNESTFEICWKCGQDR